MRMVPEVGRVSEKNKYLLFFHKIYWKSCKIG